MFQLGKKKVKNDFFFLDATVDWNNFATTFFSLFIVKLYLACTHVDRTHTQKWRSCFTNVSINGFCLKILQKSSESTTVFVFVPNGTKYFFFFFFNLSCQFDPLRANCAARLGRCRNGKLGADHIPGARSTLWRKCFLPVAKEHDCHTRCTWDCTPGQCITSFKKKKNNKKRLILLLLIQSLTISTTIITIRIISTVIFFSFF